jgi:hypothetical protein
VTAYVSAVWVRLDPRTRALLFSLLVPVVLLVVTFAPAWLGLTLSGVWVLVVLAGVLSAAVEISRERRAARSADAVYFDAPPWDEVHVVELSDGTFAANVNAHPDFGGAM